MGSLTWHDTSSSHSPFLSIPKAAASVFFPVSCSPGLALPHPTRHAQGRGHVGLRCPAPLAMPKRGVIVSPPCRLLAPGLSLQDLLSGSALQGKDGASLVNEGFVLPGSVHLASLTHPCCSPHPLWPLSVFTEAMSVSPNPGSSPSPCS